MKRQMVVILAMGLLLWLWGCSGGPTTPPAQVTPPPEKTVPEPKTNPTASETPAPKTDTPPEVKPVATNSTPVEPKPNEVELKTPVDKLSYALGMEIGGSLKQEFAEVNLPVLQQALEDILKDRKPLLTVEEATQIIQEFVNKKQEERKKIQEEQMVKTQMQAEKNQKEGEAFLAENKKKPGVVTTESGLQYQVVQMGNGLKPAATDKVKVHYRGTFIDGTEFDSSYKRGQPAQFPLNGVIRGWTEALQLMPVGSKYKLFIPANLAYGQGGNGMPPNAVLIFEVELLDIVK